jgi:alpha/beta superfamily hydrolase
MDWNETAAERAVALTERPVVLPGTHGNLYGILTPPNSNSSPAGLCAILLGRNRWFGDRLSVKGARWLAARGFYCLRFDYHGYGESEGECEIIDGDKPYSEDALAAIGYMRSEFGQQRFALAGFCFDGRTALSAVEQAGQSIATVVAVAPLPGEMASLNVHPEKAGRGITDTNLVVRVSQRFKQEIVSLVRWRVPCLFLYGTDDIEYHNFQIAERTVLAELEPVQRALITVEVWPGRVHIPEDPDRMREITARQLSWLDGFRQRPVTVAQVGVADGLRA